MKSFFLLLLCAILQGASCFEHPVHAFYYLWYGNLEHDKKWSHWNHGLLPHWTEAVRSRYPLDISFIAPHDVHAPYYPARGLYSSSNASLLLEHFSDLRDHGVGVVVVSWWGQPALSSGDSQGINTDSMLNLVFQAAEKAGIAVALHLEPYVGRNASSVRSDISYLFSKYSSYSSWYRLRRRRGSRLATPPSASGIATFDAGTAEQSVADATVAAAAVQSSAGTATTISEAPPVEGKAGASDAEALLPVMYIYDSYHIASSDWARVLLPQGDLTVRGTAVDAFFVGLWLEANHGDELARAGFDGVYTYFGTDGFSYGSTQRNWPHMTRFAEERGLIFVPCVSPGYDDTKIRPWNAANKRERRAGAYYSESWEAALSAHASFVAVTSYNEWGEGTQIEAARPRTIDVATLAPLGLALPRNVRDVLALYDSYSDYSDAGGCNFFMELTSKFSARLTGAPLSAHSQQSEEGESLQPFTGPSSTCTIFSRPDY